MKDQQDIFNNNNITNQSNITSFSLQNDINDKQLLNNNIQLNNFNQIQPNLNSNLNINNIIPLNQFQNLNKVNIPLPIENYLGQNINNQNIPSEFPLIEENNQKKELLNNLNINAQTNNINNLYNFNNNNYYNNNNNNINNNYKGGNNIKSTKPFLTLKHIFLKAHSLSEINEYINKDLSQLEKFLPNYKNYIINNNLESINICLKYIGFTHFFFNQMATSKVNDILQKIIYSDNYNYDNINNQNNEIIINYKKKIKELYKKLIPYDIRMNYLKEFYDKNCDKNLYILFKNDLYNYQGYEDKMYYLYEIFKIVQQKMDNKHKEEINRLFYNSKNQNINHNYNNNNLFMLGYDMNNETNSGNYSNNFNNYHNNNTRQYRKYSYQSPNAQNRNNNSYYNNYDNNNSYKNNGNTYHHTNFNNNKNNNFNNLNIDNEDRGFRNNHDNSHHHNSAYQRNNNYKTSFSSRHYYNNANNKNNNLRNKGNRKNSFAGDLVEVDSTPKKEEHENHSDNQLNKEENDINKINNNNEEVIPNEEHKNENEENKINDDNKENPIQINDINEANKEGEIINNNNFINDEEIDLENNLNINKENSKKENYFINEDYQLNKNDDDLENKDENIFTDFNSINPFQENITSSEENSIKEDIKEDSTNKIIRKKSQSANDIINLKIDNSFNNKDPTNNAEINSATDNQEENPLIQNIINDGQNNIINSALYDNNINILGNEPKIDMIYQNEEINKNEIEDNKNFEEIKNENNINNINIIDNKNSDNKKSRSPSPKNMSLSDNNIINVSNKKKNSNNINAKDNNKINYKNNININNNNNAINNNFTNDQLLLLKLLMLQHNNLLMNINPFHNQQNQMLNHNNNLSNLQINNNINNNNSINNHNININNFNTLNLLNNINQNINLFNNNSYYQNLYQNYNTIFFNYWNDDNNLLSNLKNNFANNHPTNYNNNINYINNKSEKLSIEYNKIKKFEKDNPERIEEFKNLFEEKIILPVYTKINEENQYKKEKYTEIYNKYKNIISKILSKHNLEDTEIEPFGSIVNNFMTEYGDIDICIVPKDNNLIQSFWEYLEEIKEEVINIQKISKFTLIERYPRFLLLKIQDIESNIDLDITVQNKLPILNTKLIRLYSLLDQRFHIFGIFLKFWVKKNKINGALDKFLSSYALLIIIIHYLQNITEPKVLPILQQIQNINNEYIYHYEEKELKTNIYFEEDLEKIDNYMNIINDNKENNSPVVDLLVGFFEFYAYKYNHYLISISRSDKMPMPEDETIAFPLEDPFDINYNPGKSMKLNTLQYSVFIYCMKKELNNILSGEYFKFSSGE